MSTTLLSLLKLLILGCILAVYLCIAGLDNGLLKPAQYSLHLINFCLLAGDNVPT
jgi:hypothetical protein